MPKPCNYDVQALPPTLLHDTSVPRALASKSSTLCTVKIPCRSINRVNVHQQTSRHQEVSVRKNIYYIYKGRKDGGLPSLPGLSLLRKQLKNNKNKTKKLPASPYLDPQRPCLIQKKNSNSPVLRDGIELRHEEVRVLRGRRDLGFPGWILHPKDLKLTPTNRVYYIVRARANSSFLQGIPA